MERELGNVIARQNNSGKTDQRVLAELLSERSNRYLVRSLTWGFTDMSGVSEIYTLQPRDPGDYEILAQSIRPDVSQDDIDVVIGSIGPGTVQSSVPTVWFEQIHSFTIPELLRAIPPESNNADFESDEAAFELFMRILRLADNRGLLAEHRALNYLILRDPALYQTVNRQYGLDHTLSAVDARPLPSDMPGRLMVEVMLSFRGRTTNLETAFRVVVDVSEEFPFIVRPLSPHIRTTP